MPAVSNTSPLILLSKIGRLELLPSLFERVLIPSAVLHEILQRDVDDVATRSVTNASWIEVREVPNVVSQPDFPAGLHEGEAAAIRLALTLSRSVPILLDDLSARRYASRQGLRVAGTGGVLVGAKEAGFLASVRPDLDRLRDAGLRISDQAYMTILELGDEQTTNP